LHGFVRVAITRKFLVYQTMDTTFISYLQGLQIIFKRGLECSWLCRLWTYILLKCRRLASSGTLFNKCSDMRWAYAMRSDVTKREPFLSCVVKLSKNLKIAIGEQCWMERIWWFIFKTKFVVHPKKSDRSDPELLSTFLKITSSKNRRKWNQKNLLMRKKKKKGQAQWFLFIFLELWM